MSEKSVLDLANEFARQCGDAQLESTPVENPGSNLVSFKRLTSDALKVHPKQRMEAIEDAKRKGVPTDFNSKGQPIFTSSRHFRAYARAYGFVHRGYA